MGAHERFKGQQTKRAGKPGIKACKGALNFLSGIDDLFTSIRHLFIKPANDPVKKTNADLQETPNPQKVRRRPYAAAIIAGCAGVLLSLLAFSIIRGMERANFQQAFEHEAESSLSVLRITWVLNFGTRRCLLRKRLRP